MRAAANTMNDWCVPFSSNGITFTPTPQARSVISRGNNLPFGIGLNAIPFNEFVRLICFTVALGVGVYDGVQLALPRVSLPFYQPYLSNDSFAQYYPDNKDVPTDDISQLREQALHDAIDAGRRAAFQSARFVLIIVAIDVAVFVVHWRIAKGPA